MRCGENSEQLSPVLCCHLYFGILCLCCCRYIRLDMRTQTAPKKGRTEKTCCTKYRGFTETSRGPFFQMIHVKYSKAKKQQQRTHSNEKTNSTLRTAPPSLPSSSGSTAGLEQLHTARKSCERPGDQHTATDEQAKEGNHTHHRQPPKQRAAPTRDTPPARVAVSPAPQ